VLKRLSRHRFGNDDAASEADVGHVEVSNPSQSSIVAEAVATS
jgi:hypothetical protein